jgi:hypothetical protein
MISVDSYKKALEELGKDESPLIINGFSMLKANYRSPGRLISATRLSNAADKDYDGVGAGNIQYGKFAHRIANLIDHIPQKSQADGTPAWTYTLCEAHQYKDRNGHFQWILRPEVAAAMEELGLVKRIVTHDALDDIASMEEVCAALPEKERMNYQKARIGQGKFRSHLLSYWEGCAVTGCTMLEVLIASHIRPWRDCTVEQATTMPNGLLLIPNLDTAFDKGLITFEDDGAIKLSPQLKPNTAQHLGINSDMRIRSGKLTENHFEYLRHHREIVFQRAS